MDSADVDSMTDEEGTLPPSAQFATNTQNHLSTLYPLYTPRIEEICRQLWLMPQNFSLQLVARTSAPWPDSRHIYLAVGLRNVVGKVSQLDADMNDPNRMHLVRNEAASIEATLAQYGV